MREQRQPRSFDLVLPVEVTRIGARKTSIRGETRHLSSTGILLVSDHFPGQLGQSVEYSISMPPTQEGQPVVLRCLGKVLRLNPDEGSSEISLERHEFFRDELASRASA